MSPLLQTDERRSISVKYSCNNRDPCRFEFFTFVDLSEYFKTQHMNKLLYLSPTGFLPRTLDSPEIVTHSLLGHQLPYILSKTITC